jgi:hypothetical protein
MIATQPIPAQEYRIAPELRRCCWYAISGAVVVGGLFYWVARFLQARGAADIILGCVVFGLLAAAMIVPLNSRLRLDEHGLARRLLFRWDFWTWQDLASGRIRKLHPYTLLDPERPWWRRRLRLEYLGSGVLQEVLAAVNRHYRLPPAPDLPHTLTIKYGFRRSLVLDYAGIHLRVRGCGKEYAWHDIRQLHFTRMDPLRRDFQSLRIVLPDEEIVLKLVTHQGGTSPAWRGVTSEEINEFLLRYVAPARIETSIAGEALKKREHIEQKLKEVEKRKRALLA